MIRTLALSGNLRAGASNNAQQIAPEGMQIEVATWHGVPLYGGVQARVGIRAAVQALKARIVVADGQRQGEATRPMPGAGLTDVAASGTAEDKA